jgi:hypothetical protein
MTSTISEIKATETDATSETLAALIQRPGPYLTLLLPDIHPGAPEGSRAATVRDLVKSAGQPAAVAKKIEAAIPEGGGPGYIVYRSPESLQWFRLSGQTARVVTGSHPYVLPLLEPTFKAHEFVVVGLSTEHLRLYEYANGVCHLIEIPEAIPGNVAAAGHFHRGSGTPAEGHTSAGPSVGGMTGVRFGTAGGRESAHDAFEHYCVRIDQGLHALLDGRPLLLMGVKEEIAAYRRVSHYPSLMHAEVDGNIDAHTPSQVAKLAQKAALEEYRRIGEEVLSKFREMRDRARTSHDPHDVLKAAVAGRVHQLCVRAGTENLGPLEGDLDRAHLPHEDLINAAAVEVLRKGGDVFVLPQDRLAITESLCAILRY